MVVSPGRGGSARGLSRRAFLRGAGATLALPFLESLAPARAAEAEAPLRLLFVFAPNGVHMPDWTPGEEGAGFALPWILEPLERHREHLLVLSGLTLDGARAHGDGPGDHARAAGAFLTCAHPYKTGGADVRVGVSVDQVAAARLGRRTRLASLELGCERGSQAGACDSGYACAYSSNVSWRTPSSPMAKEVDPRRVYERLFLDPERRLPPDERERRRRFRARVLDLVRGDARDLRRRLGGADRAKLDEYLEGVRELERRLERASGEGGAASDLPPAPEGVPPDPGEHQRLLYDLLVLAFQGDQTRVASLMLGNGGSNRSYPLLGVPEGHHHLSHHGRDPEKQEKIRRINRFHVEQLAHLLDGLAAAREGEGSLLDRCAIVYGSGIGDGDRHNHDDLPVLLLGGAGGQVASGRHVRFPAETPLANLYLALLRAAGVGAPSFGDSAGVLPLA